MLLWDNTVTEVWREHCGKSEENVFKSLKGSRTVSLTCWLLPRSWRMKKDWSRGNGRASMGGKQSLQNGRKSRTRGDGREESMGLAEKREQTKVKTDRTRVKRGISNCLYYCGTAPMLQRLTPKANIIMIISTLPKQCWCLRKQSDIKCSQHATKNIRQIEKKEKKKKTQALKKFARKYIEMILAIIYYLWVVGLWTILIFFLLIWISYTTVSMNTHI